MKHSTEKGVGGEWRYKQWTQPYEHREWYVQSRSRKMPHVPDAAHYGELVRLGKGLATDKLVLVTSGDWDYRAVLPQPTASEPMAVPCLHSLTASHASPLMGHALESLRSCQLVWNWLAHVKQFGHTNGLVLSMDNQLHAALSECHVAVSREPTRWPLLAAL